MAAHVQLDRQFSSEVQISMTLNYNDPSPLHSESNLTTTTTYSLYSTGP